MHHDIHTIETQTHLQQLLEIPTPPARMYLRGVLPPSDARFLAVVGSRDYSDYGARVVAHLISGLRGYPISIVSGLALGIDALAHQAALEAGLHTIAVPGSGIDDSVLYPRSNRGLAHNILNAGGALISEFEPTFTATQWSFPQRNRIMAGLAHAVLLIEAGERSGTLITARLASDFNRDVLVVPGNIFSKNSTGVHQFLKLGATPITESLDILSALSISPRAHNTEVVTPLSREEADVCALLSSPRDSDSIIRALNRPADEVLILLARMELHGHIVEHNGIFSLP